MTVEQSGKSASGRSTVLCVDLDGTLIRTDLLFESLCALLRLQPLAIFLVPFWLLRGRANLKSQIARRVQLDPALLPYNFPFLEFLRNEAGNGRKLILTTASDHSYARLVADHLGIFTAAHGSDGSTNLKGEQKLDLIRKQYGSSFEYAGNSSADIPIWAASERALVVSSDHRLRARVSKIKESAFFDNPLPTLLSLVRAMRMHQWVKNLLVFVPLFLAHDYLDQFKLAQAIVAFFGFSFCASGVYLLNDLFDLASDRAHRTKKFRPVASGELPIQLALFFIPLLWFVSLWCAIFLPLRFVYLLLGYFAITSLYSIRLKTVPIVDIMTLATLYTIRIVAGGAATDVLVSHWLAAFSMFLFVSLACIKRFSEVYALRQSGSRELKGRGYNAHDLEQISQFGSASGYISVLVLALYINSKEVRSLYGQPDFLWLICPIFLYWVSRIWFLAHRGEVDDDPIVFALRDLASYIVGFTCLVILFIAI